MHILTRTDTERIDTAVKRYGMLAISLIACELALTREYVQDYVRGLNGALPLTRVVEPVGREPRSIQRRHRSGRQNPRVKPRKAVMRPQIGPWPNTLLLREPFRAMSQFHPDSKWKEGVRAREYAKWLLALPMKRKATATAAAATGLPNPYMP